jgi:hypothetical protein
MDDSAPLNPCVEKTIALVFETFRDVTLEGGVSWSESIAFDKYNSEREWQAARGKDCEPGWEVLANDPDWEPFPGGGGFHFLDAIGFRYYLPVALVKKLRGEYGSGGEIDQHLNIRGGFRASKLEMLSALQPEEIQCVCEFLKCMMAVEDYPPDPELGYFGEDSWERAYRSHWVNLDANPLPE